MTDPFGPMDAAKRDAWFRSFVPSDITFLDLKTEKQVQEPSLVAVKRTPDVKNPRFADYVLAVGSAALAYQDNPDALVYSPLRHGQIADYAAAVYMFRQFFRQLRPGLRLWKPVMYVLEQEYTTEVEERALIDAMFQIGARKVICCLESLPELLVRARSERALKNACVLYIEPREKKETL